MEQHLIALWEVVLNIPHKYRQSYVLRARILEKMLLVAMNNQDLLNSWLFHFDSIIAECKIRNEL